MYNKGKEPLIRNDKRLFARLVCFTDTACEPHQPRQDSLFLELGETLSCLTGIDA